MVLRVGEVGRPIFIDEQVVQISYTNLEKRRSTRCYREVVKQYIPGSG